MTDVVVRPARPDEHAPLAELVLEAYRAVPGLPIDAGYEAELRDVAGRAASAEVLVATDAEGRLLGTATYVGDPSSPLAEGPAGGEPQIRMLAVATAAQGRGVGEALTRACIERAAAEGHATLFLYSERAMTTAHRLYGRLGFERSPAEDWDPLPGVALLAFRLRLRLR